MNLALFDFDGTITQNDSLLKFLHFCFGKWQLLRGLIRLSPTLLAYKLKLISNHSAKEKVFSYFFSGMPEKNFKNLAKSFSLNHIDPITRPKAMERIAWHKNRGDKVIIVSASIECWLRPWCENKGLELIATKIEFKHGIVTGKFQTKNCYGPEKVARILEQLKLKNFDYIYAYGDSSGDEELLALASQDKRYFRYFN